MMARALTFIPCDLGASIGGSGLDSKCIAVLNSNGWFEDSGDALTYRKDDSHLVFIRAGLAVLVLDWTVDGNVLDFCRQRGLLHKKLRNEDESVLPCDFLRTIRELRSTLRVQKRADRRRFMSPRIVHYAFTTVFLDSEPESKDLYVYLNPSFIGLADSRTGELDLSFYNDDLCEGRLIVESGSNNEASAFGIRTTFPTGGFSIATWASLLVVGTLPDDIVRFIIATESSVQASWLAAWLAQNMAESILDSRPQKVSTKQVKWQCLEFQGMEYWNSRRFNPSESMFHQEFRHSLEVTSGLKSEWDTALVATTRAQELSQLIESERESRQSAMLDVLLLLLSLTSLAQILYAVPIVSWSSLLAAPAQLIALTMFAITGSILIFRSRR